MKYWQIVISCVLAVVVLFFPLSAQAASSSNVTSSLLNKVVPGQDFSGQSLIGKEFTSVKLENTNFSNADLRGAVFNGALLDTVNLHGVDFSEGIAYLSRFKNADLSDAIFTDAMMLRSSFDQVNITGADFTNAILDMVQVKKLCLDASGVNSQTGADTRESLRCK
ncbi:MAG: hypothetical protein RLZZ176_235 [Cyanobacteriota bacterium]|jgi:uncharacterized protein YjbI with pentapeptide repeats|uniref:Pentapeptide repeat-containing protein n=1 Tax=Cuspidothrix issatschenkoi CHARLIE-1 TaxID=2052836 RepID=A0A2S6CSB2_9CYAN|nr:pentapeptide repeat-containing protein [Cuspidothrix issatschenkoi]PPJ62633.1 hypothetical protein CUN59_14435 [Cuspidothrix issatschenkoi CHARLIE-1]